MVILRGTLSFWLIILASLAMEGAVQQTAAGGPAEAQGAAEHFKDLGDRYASEDRLAEAAEAYQEALSLGRRLFSSDDRVRMAMYMSWDDRLSAAIDEFRQVLTEEPEHLAARVHLARVYSWSGALSAAITEADRILFEHPDHREALLIKADALEWQGRFRQAIPIYRDVSERHEDFDAGLGLSYALLSGGNRAAARQNARQLAPADLRQQNSLNRLSESIDSVSRPRLDFRHLYYQDTDDNRTHRYSLLHGFALGNHGFEINLRRVDNRSLAGHSRSRAATFSFLSNLTEGLSIGGGAGLTRSGTSGTSNRVTGQFHMDSAVSNGRVGLSAASDILVDTVQLTQSSVRTTGYSGYFTKPWTDRLSTFAGYTYKHFSDGNHAHDVQFSPQFAVVLKPRIAAGYRFRFLDFNQQSLSGYFDPQNYTSHRLFGSLAAEKEKIYAYLDVYAGQQTFSRRGHRSEDWIIGGSASAGFRPVPRLAIEINVEGGDFAAGSVTGFRYFVAGSRVSFRF